MPNYKYKCRNCEETFSVKATLKEKNEGLELTCPQCGAEDVFQTFDSVGVIGGGSQNSSSGGSACTTCGGNLGCCG